MTEGAAVLAGDHGLHVAGHGVDTILSHAGRLGQQRHHTIRLQHDVVPLVWLRLELDRCCCGDSNLDRFLLGLLFSDRCKVLLCSSRCLDRLCRSDNSRCWWRVDLRCDIGDGVVGSVHAGWSGGQTVRQVPGHQGGGGGRSTGGSWQRVATNQRGGGDSDELTLGGLHQHEAARHRGGPRSSSNRLASSLGQLNTVKISDIQTKTCASIEYFMA